MTGNPTNGINPNNHVLAVLSENAVEGTMRDLEHNGYSSYRPYGGEMDAREIDAKGDHSGPIGKIVKMVNEHLSEEPNYLAQYEEESRNGNVVIAVKVDDKEKTPELTALLERHGARNVRYFGTMAVSDLTPLSNPSLRSSDSPEEAAKQQA